MKKCANKKCDIKVLQPYYGFYKRPNTNDGYSSYCRKCEQKRTKNDYHKKKNENELLKNFLHF